MHSVGLTHGGFYGHFESRSDLIAQALERALTIGEDTARAVPESPKTRSYGGIVRNYLSRTHRDYRDSGCAIAALAGDAGRSDLTTRAVMEEHIVSFIEAVQHSLGESDDKKAILAVCAMVGGVMLSRVVTDSKRSNAILQAVREQLLSLEPAD